MAIEKETIKNKLQRNHWRIRRMGLEMYKFAAVNVCTIILLLSIISLASAKENNTGYPISTVGMEVIEARAEEKVEAKVEAKIGVKVGVKVEAKVEVAEKESVEDKHENEDIKNRWNITLNEAEKDTLARIVMLEARGESSLGQQAVIEVVFNRVYSPLFPDTVHDVLSQKNKNIAQFSTWKNRDSNEATPSTQVIANISEVLEGKTDILPFNTLYFSQKGENVKVQVTIGNHVFCNQ